MLQYNKSTFVAHDQTRLLFCLPFNSNLGRSPNQRHRLQCFTSLPTRQPGVLNTQPWLSCTSQGSSYDKQTDSQEHGWHRHRCFTSPPTRQPGVLIPIQASFFTGAVTEHVRYRCFTVSLLSTLSHSRACSLQMFHCFASLYPFLIYVLQTCPRTPPLYLLTAQ